jgi:hypothetical protein
LYNRIVRLIPSLLLILCLAGCQHGGNNTDAVRQGVIDRLVQQKFDMNAMDIKVAAVQFNGDQADATVAVSLKGKNDAPPMSFRYHLKHQGGKWVVTGLSNDGAHGGAAAPGAGGANPHGGAMPPAAGGADNPHGGMAPGGGAMPSPQDLPPATKK